MRSKNKATKWIYDGKRGRRMSKRMANVIERRKANLRIKSFTESNAAKKEN
jgi:hypothetical protein